MKRIGILLFSLLLLCFSSGCQRKTSVWNGAEYFQYATEFPVTFSVSGHHYSGTLYWDGDGSFRLVHSDPSSPLCGMEESLNGTFYSARFMGLVMEEDKILPESAEILACFDLLWRGTSVSETVGDNTEDTRIICENDDRCVVFCYDEKTGAPTYLKGTSADRIVEATFSTQNSSEKISE